jgi:hypothetical protein
MAKSAAPDVNAFISSFTRNRQPAAAPEADASPEPAMLAYPSPAPAPETPRAAPSLMVARAEEAGNQKGRKEPALAEQADRPAYTELFLQPVRGRKNKAVYLNEDTHAALAVIIQASDGLPMADLLINIITHHFETYGPDIRAFVTDQEKKNNKKRLPF